ncbi:thyroid receptor-interacting protein 6 [Erpetoichthys calabaricus]|uniref:thyroid receptor-interacting protein 6 n=1 Tax=Erpetoichthys calabaricus TaxID=27687 RepID=UPI002234397E|nr:thyroid receptor-interacting protein 6 [Erpetoichthys calabaricus]XP_028654245.2 thyroid receptor-interacting protein 6 [Erpetoichthys calabaricus]
MSGPTWLPPKTLGSPERQNTTVSSSSSSAYKSSKKMPQSAKQKYSAYEQNGEIGGMVSRYQTQGPADGLLPHSEDLVAQGQYPLPPVLGDHYYQTSPGSKDERNAWHHPSNTFDSQARIAEKTGSHSTNIDAEIDSLTSMLADMESAPQYVLHPCGPVYDNMTYSKQPMDRYKPAQSSAAQSTNKQVVNYHHSLQQSSHLPQQVTQVQVAQHHTVPQYAGVPSTAYPSPQMSPYSPPSNHTVHQMQQISSYSPQQMPGYVYSSQGQKPYPQPVPASYTTASTPTGPRFSVQVKTAQPVSTYSQTSRQAEQAYAPPSPRQAGPQHAEPPYRERTGPYSEAGQNWYPTNSSQPNSSPQDVNKKGYRGYSPPGPRLYQAGVGVPKRNQETLPPAPTQTVAYPAGKTPVSRPEDELDRLTKKLVYDMNHPPTEEYFGRCARCGNNVVGDGTGCIAMDQVFHVECFTCITCQCRLRGQPFYAIEKKSYCENCYISTLERCSKCSHPILDRILRAMGKAYHPHCFTCVVCNRCLDGVPFTVDATSQIHCIEDFHRKFAPRCSVCGEAIMPEKGQEETVRIVALDRSFHVNCYVCEECGLLLSSEGEGRGCYPLDGHILCKSCSARRIQELSSKISTDC